jgi:aromatic-amino-acid transaminase
MENYGSDSLIIVKFQFSIINYQFSISLYHFRMFRTHFSSLPAPTPDPIFSATAEALAAGPTAINGTIGVYMDEEGNTLMFPSVKKAITDCARDFPTARFGYPPLLGLPEFRSVVTRLMFGEHSPFVASIATTAGTGSLAVNLRLLRMLAESGEIYLPVPAWVNHSPPSLDAGFVVKEVPYLVEGHPDIAPLCDAIKRRKGKKGFGLLLQVGCNNPTGLDYSDDDWQRLIANLAGRSCTVLLDFAYQGLKNEPEEDASVIRRFVEAKVPILVSWSASKNHSIYSLRTGLACAVVPDEATRKAVEGRYSMITRRLHSAATTIGQIVVARVQQHYAQEWHQDLLDARRMLSKKRTLLREHLPKDFQTSLAGYGMFAMLPLSSKQVERLKQEKVFLTPDGRINIAGIPLARIEELCLKVMNVL